jgi:hypothetical protein
MPVVFAKEALTVSSIAISTNSERGTMDLTRLVTPEHQHAVLPHLDDEQRTLIALLIVNDPSVRVAYLGPLAQMPYAKLIVALALSAERDGTAEQIWQIAFKHMDPAGLVVAAYSSLAHATATADREQMFAALAAHTHLCAALSLYANHVVAQAVNDSAYALAPIGAASQVPALIGYVTDDSLAATAADRGLTTIATSYVFSYV